MDYHGLFLGISDNGAIYFEGEFSELINWNALPPSLLYRAAEIPEKERRPVIHYDSYRNPIIEYEGPQSVLKERPRIRLFRLRSEDGQRRFRDAQGDEYFVKIEAE